MHELFLKETLRQGVYFSTPESVNQIPSFVEHYTVDMNNYVISNVKDYQNFNEFFTRAILPEKRPIAEKDDEVCVYKCISSSIYLVCYIECSCLFCRLQIKCV